MSKPLRILLIEDSERDAALLLLHLRRGGYQPTLDRVETEAEMQHRLASGSWDVVISDVRLPKFGAAAALRTLRQAGHSAPFIVLSGEADERVRQQMMAHGAADYLLKHQMAQIVATIEEVMQNSG